MIRESFSKVFENPILDRAENELYSATCSWMIEDEKDGYIMFYAKGNPWVEVNGKLECTYNIVRATTSDGIKFRRDSSHIINTVLDDEVNTRPSVIWHDGFYHLWFCYRSVTDFRDGIGSYKIGYACSKDTVNWKRLAQSTIEHGPETYDESMTAYPYVLKTSSKLIMFYNGNSFGKTGICAAIADL